MFCNVYARTSTMIVDPVLHFVDANKKGERSVELLLAFCNCYIDVETNALFAVARDIKTNRSAFINISENIRPTSIGNRSYKAMLVKLRKHCEQQDLYGRNLESGGKVQRQHQYRNPRYYYD